MTVSVNDFTPVSDEIIDLFKQDLGRNGLTVAYLYGVMWRLCGQGLFDGAKQVICDLSRLDRKTVNKYLSWLVEQGHIEEVYQTETQSKPYYKLGKSELFRFTVELSTARQEKSGSFPKSRIGNMSSKVGNMSPVLGNMSSKNDLYMIHDNDSCNNIGNNTYSEHDEHEHLKEMWTYLGLDLTAFNSMLKYQSIEQLDYLLSDWCEWYESASDVEIERHGPGLIYNSLKEGVFAPKGEQGHFLNEFDLMMQYQLENGYHDGLKVKGGNNGH